MSLAVGSVVVAVERHTSTGFAFGPVVDCKEDVVAPELAAVGSTVVEEQHWHGEHSGRRILRDAQQP